MDKHYSGELSKPFWERVRRLPQPQRDTLYLLGCMLQDMEGRVFQLLSDGEEQAVAKDGCGTKRSQRPVMRRAGKQKKATSR